MLDDLGLARLVLESGAIIWHVAEDQLVVDEPGARLFGVHRGAFGTQLADLLRRIRDDHRDEVARALERAVTEGGLLDVELAIDLPGTTVRYLQLRGTVLHDSDGAVQRVVFGVRDASAIVGLREELAEARRAAMARDQEQRRAMLAIEETARTRALLLASLSHEIRTRLNAVLGMGQLLADADLSVEQRERVSTIRAAGDELLAFAADIVDVSTADSPSESDLASVAIRELLAGVVRAFVEEVGAKQLAIRFDVDAGVPAAVRADGTRLARALHHLVRNAILSTTTGEIAIVARVAPLLPASADLRPLYDLAIEVCDTGSTIVKDTRFGGLELSVGTRLIERIGGRVDIQREAGRGTIVRINLTVDETVPESASRVTIDGAMAMRHPLRILIAEDNPVNRKVVDAFLAKLGYTARHATDGREAIAAAAREPFDLVLMDIHMPEVNGLEATAEIRRRAQAQPRIVALTANALPQDRAACLEAGCDEYLTKPITIEKLARALLACPQRVQVEPDPFAIDERAFARLELAIGAPLLAEVVAAHAADAREVVGAIHAAIDRNDATDLVRLAQMLTHASQALTASKLGVTSAGIEALARRGDTTSARTLATRAAGELAQVCAALDQLAEATRIT